MPSPLSVGMPISSGSPVPPPSPRVGSASAEPTLRGIGATMRTSRGAPSGSSAWWGPPARAWHPRTSVRGR
eukprot:3041408-Alexandrium_andersonii.AAC.1